jgi:hypothetical protein
VGIVRIDSVRDVVGSDVDACSFAHFGDLPMASSSWRVGAIVRDDLHRLHDALPGHEVDEPRLGDVAIRNRLAP